MARGTYIFIETFRDFRVPSERTAAAGRGHIAEYRERRL